MSEIKKINPLSIVFAVIFIGVVCYFSWGGGRSVSDKYKLWVKTEAVIDDVSSNGRIGKGQSDVWAISFKDSDGNEYHQEIMQSTFLSKKVGDKIIVYYDPKNPQECMAEDIFEEVKYRD